MTVKVFGLAILGILLLAACTPISGGSPDGEALSQPTPVLNDLGGVNELKAKFNEDEGVPRVLLLLSPT